MRILGLTGPPAGPSASLYAASLGEDTSEGHSEEELLEETETTAEAAALPPYDRAVTLVTTYFNNTAVRRYV